MYNLPIRSYAADGCIAPRIGRLSGHWQANSQLGAYLDKPYAFIITTTLRGNETSSRKS